MNRPYKSFVGVGDAPPAPKNIFLFYPKIHLYLIDCSYKRKPNRMQLQLFVSNSLPYYSNVWEHGTPSDPLPPLVTMCFLPWRHIITSVFVEPVILHCSGDAKR